jgi:hypothetical protein
MDDKDNDVVVFVMALIMDGPEEVSVPNAAVSACDELMVEMLVPIIVCGVVELLPGIEDLVPVLDAEPEEYPVELKADDIRDAVEDMESLEAKLEDVAWPADDVDVAFPVAEAVVDNVPSM